MKKLFVLMLSFLLKPLTNRSEPMHPILELKEFFRENALKVAAGLTLMYAMGTMLAGGAGLVIMNLADQYDRGIVSPTLTARVAGGLILMFISLLFIVVLYSLSTRNEKQMKKASHREKAGPSPIEAAIALLIQDIIKEREEKREAAAFKREQAKSASEMYGPGFKSPEEFERH